MIEEIPWTAASAVGAALAGGWTIAWLTFHKRGKDGSSMKERYERAEERAKDAESRYEEVRGKAEESEKLARRSDDLRKEMEDLQRESARLDEAREALDKFAAEEEAKIREIAREGEQAREKRDGIRKETDELEEMNKTLQEQLEAKRKRIEDLEQRTSEIGDTEAQLAEKAREIEALEARERESRMRASIAGEEVRTAQEQKNRLEGKIEELKGSKEHWEEEVRDARKESEETEGMNKKRRAELEAVERELANKEASAAEMEDRKKKEEEEVRSLETRKGILQREVEKLEGRTGGAGGEQPGDEHDRGRLGNLASPPGCVGGERTGSPREEEDEALKEALGLIRGQGLEFHQRMVWRLHTSLKVSEVSPLTVLAGISGTGKTQLPRAYAEAMGMYLLVVPVQPRWDSPMDLVGSYDYLHGRYQATELARLLWDFDRERRDPSGDDRMAMVLLDEMNLARTEYYFSDFLSRLELRRAGEPSPEAMIELDIPHGEGEEPERIYPSERIVWVGTMNEDESTQTLSDKVIDRSNVIRFPRPKEIAFTAKAKGKDGNGQEAQQKALTAGQWRQWCEGRKMPDEARRTIATINEEVMERVGRPFGHRMGQSMARYVERYPSGEWRNALADQVEMRVLPKLTGLDGANDGAAGALDRLRRICAEDLEDEELAKAVTDATDIMHNAGTFAWSGRQIG